MTQLHDNNPPSITPPRVVLVGRMNVGKSTLFNRLVEENKGIVSSIPGTTRDRRESIASWRGLSFLLVDTGGIDTLITIKAKRSRRIAPSYFDSSEFFTAEIKRQTQIALTETDRILFVVDGREGLLPQERIWAQTLKKTGKPILLVVNKLERKTDRANLHEFWKLGLGEPHPISALTGVGTGDLLDVLVAPMTERPTEEPHITPLRLLLIGKPNVGKSSLVNALVQRERMIVSPLPHTTREPIPIAFDDAGKPRIVIDTAGIRKHRNIGEGLEKVGVERSLGELERADVTLFVIESHELLGVQDLHLGQEIVQQKTGVIIVANKWDLTQQKSKFQIPNSKIDTVKRHTEYLRRQMPHLAFAPILFISAKTGHNVQKILPLAEKIERERKRIIPSETLDGWLRRLTYKSGKGNTPKPHVYGIKQTNIMPPTFELVTEFKMLPTRHGKQKTTVRASYIGFIENQLRATFDFEGTPIVLKIRTIQ